jgi:hypothetical protein
MKAVFFLSNFYGGPLEGQGLKPDDPGHPLHWLRETDQGWESIPLVAGKPQHFEIAPQAIKHARDHGFEVHYNHPLALKGHHVAVKYPGVRPFWPSSDARTGLS